VLSHTKTNKSNLAQWTVNKLLRKRVPHYNRIGRESKSNSVYRSRERERERERERAPENVCLETSQLEAALSTAQYTGLNMCDSHKHIHFILYILFNYFDVIFF